MADQMMRTAGRGDDGLAKALKTDNSGNLKVLPFGNAVEEVILFNAVSIRDTANLEATIDLSKYRSVTFIANSRLDKDITIFFRNNGSQFKVWNGTEYVELKTTLSTSARYFNIILNSVLPELNNNFTNTTVRIQCPVAPTAETFTMRVVGELR